MAQWHESSPTHHRLLVIGLQFPGTAEGVSLTGPDFKSSWSQLYVWVTVAPYVFFGEE